MKLLLRLTDILLYSSLFAACCATGLCMATERLVGGAIPPLINELHLLVFGSTLVVYNIPRIVQAATKKTRINRLWYIAFFSIGLGMTLYALILLPQQIVIVSFVLGVFGFAYSLPLLPFKNRKRLREIGWVKILVLTGVWTVASSVLPVLYLGRSVSDYPLEVLLRFILVFALCIAFDIRDMHIDRQNNIDTLPHKMGTANSYHLINTSLLLFIMLSIFQYTRFPQPARLAGAVITSVVTWLVVAYLRRHPSDRGHLLLADGVMLLYAALILLL